MYREGFALRLGPFFFRSVLLPVGVYDPLYVRKDSFLAPIAGKILSQERMRMQVAGPVELERPFG